MPSSQRDSHPRSRAHQRDLILSGLAIVLSAATVVTCSAIGPRAATSPAPGGSTASSAGPIETASASSALPETSVGPETTASAEVPPEPQPSVPAQAHAGVSVSAEGNALPRATRLFDALAALKDKRRDRPVRVMWLGDSHTQADFWTAALRASLQARFGKGGPGFVHIGWSEKKYRHGDVRIKTQGGWRIEPPTLVSTRKYDDGVLGLGGVRLVPSDAGARASLAVEASAVPGKVRWDVAFRLADPAASLTLRVSGASPLTVTSADTKVAAGPGGIRHVALESPGPGGTIEVAPSGQAELMGVVIESSEPGVVVDTLGLNGARVASALAMDEASWVSAVSRRAPDLVVIAYGSNESSDMKFNAARHASAVESLLRRIRAGAPNADCLVFGPVDRGGKRYGETVVHINAAQRDAAQRAGCAFWSGQMAMGGKGSMERWEVETPPLAQADLLHLTPKGYERLGNMLARDLLQAFDAHSSASPQASAP